MNERRPGLWAGPIEAVVAIPVRNEEERIAACLVSLADQQGLGPRRLGVVLFLNNCTDRTAEVARARAEGLPIEVRIVERSFAGANAGWARREAMEIAASWLEADGVETAVILTTDADSRVPPDWVARNLAGIAAGVDAVAGTVALDEEEAARLPAALHERGARESAYETLLIRLEAKLDPLPHDPWPRHWTTSGASLAVRLSAYRRVGGMPPLALGEDRAFVSSLLSSDALVRHDPAIVVVTSGRLQGRAEGGAADTMRLRCDEPEAPCDPRLEPIGRALLRFAWRARLRRREGATRLAAREASHPAFRPRPLRPRQLPRHTFFARVALALIGAAARLVPTLEPVATPPLAARPERARS